LDKEALLSEISDFYLKSNDFNGISVCSLARKYGLAEIRAVFVELISEGKVSLVYGDYHPNPHIKALPSEPIAEQLGKLDTDKFDQALIYAQRKLMHEIYRTVKVIRLVLSLHPETSKVKVNRHLEEGLIWPR
jgi:hypothetical protein